MRPEDPGGATAHSPARLGAGDGPIEIVEYDPCWPAAYDAERERLASLVPGVRIHHIGSSAVPGLVGKAVIDMIALVDDLDADSGALIQRAGYELPARFNVDLVHRRFLCYPTAPYRTHHLHLASIRH
jgi:GrpB-like predicted nucleotidyltransferase (UPF0157 family)